MAGWSTLQKSESSSSSRPWAGPIAALSSASGAASCRWRPRSSSTPPALRSALPCSRSSTSAGSPSPDRSRPRRLFFGIVIALDLLVVVPFFEKSFAMFRSPLGTTESPTTGTRRRRWSRTTSWSSRSAAGRTSPSSPSHQTTGKVVWSSQTDAAAYSSPLTITVGGVRQIVFFSASGLFCGGSRRRSPIVAATAGIPAVRLPAFRSIVAHPIFIAPDRIFISGGYGTRPARRSSGDRRRRRVSHRDSLEVRGAEEPIEFVGSVTSITSTVSTSGS